MIHRSARVATGRQGAEAGARQLRAGGRGQVFRDTARGERTDRTRLAAGAVSTPLKELAKRYNAGWATISRLAA